MLIRMSQTTPRNLEWIDGGPWMASLAAGQFAAVIRGARELRKQGCIGAFHLELLGHVAQRHSDGVSDAKRLIGTLTMQDLYERAPELLEAPNLWLEATSWFLHHELRRQLAITSGERVEELILGELGLVRSNACPEETAAFKALALIKEGDLEGAFDQLFEAPGDTSQARGSVFRRAGHALFQSVPRQQRLDVLRYKRGKTPSSYGLAPFPGHGFLIKEYVGTTQSGSSALLGGAPSTLSPIMTAGWIEGWKASDGFPETEDFARVERLLTSFGRGTGPS